MRSQLHAKAQRLLIEEAATSDFPLIECGDPQRDSQGFRDCLGLFSTGVAVVTAQVGAFRVGVTVNSFSSVSLDPPLVLWAIGRRSRSFGLFERADHFCVNILSAGQVHLARQFAKSADDKFLGVPCTPGTDGQPVISGAAATLECAVETRYPGGDHVIILGRVKRFARRNEEPLVFSRGRFCTASEHQSSN